jgi:hypothetical protein
MAKERVESSLDRAGLVSASEAMPSADNSAMAANRLKIVMRQSFIFPVA